MNATPQMLNKQTVRNREMNFSTELSLAAQNCMSLTSAAAGQKNDTKILAPHSYLKALPELDIRFERQHGIYWQIMAPTRRPSCTLEFLQSVQASHAQVRELANHHPGALRYFVTASNMPGIFNLGGDLPHFAELIRRRDRAGLLEYAITCIDVQADRATNMNLPYISISLVQGDALGGGFECALADDVIVAEKGTKFGLPEILFGLFPGMGAYSFLTRKLGGAQAERMITSGRIYQAEELHEMGLVEVLAEPGEGVGAVYDFVRRQERTFGARTALSRIRQRVQPVTREELQDITEIWVDTALRLEESDLRKMQRLAKAQDRRRQSSEPGPASLAA